MATPLTALETYRQTIQYHPFHFWGLAGTNNPAAISRATSGAPTQGCRPILRQHGWQAGDAVSRDAIAQALVEAETRMAAEFGAPIAPQFGEATVTMPRFHDPAWQQGSDARGLWSSVRLPVQRVQACGVETITTLATATYAGPFPSPSAPSVGQLVYRDLDQDGLPDTAQIAITDSTTPLDQIAVLIAAADRFDGSPASRAWVRPHTTIARSGSTVTISLPAWTLVQPVRYEGVASLLNGLDPLDSTVMVQSVEVARVWCNPDGTTVDTAQAMLIWDSGPASWPWCCTPLASTDPAAIGVAVARVALRQANVGMVAPAAAVWDATTSTWAATDTVGWWGCAPPDRVVVRYLAGVASDDPLAPALSRAAIGFAASLLGRPLTGCQETSSLVAAWQTDVTRAAGGETFQAQPSANNPFGPRRGAIEAYQLVSRQRLTRGIRA